MFEGAYTAIVTPFAANGTVDYVRFQSLVDLQIKAGIDGIVPVGTTGESPTLDMDEHKRVIEMAVQACRGRIKVIAGTGANSTSEAEELTRAAKAAGADGTLQVAPYYNKPSQEGLYRHFSTVADIGLPVVLYNIPGRTGVEIAVETVLRLAAHPGIVAVKEAAGNVNRVSQLTAETSMTILSGDDSLTLPMMIVGGKGVISVASNVAPKAVADMVHHALNGRWEQARELHRTHFRLFTDLFLETNPVPVKAALALMGLCEETYRLPLCPMNPALKQKLAACMKDLRLI